ncbi:hypothetical protein NNRS527_01715 [Nitrosospira sp. NRS527]|nr:hypothetical protein NNRS527_01715 [Nitrosospira sp. NRS527]
MIHRWFSHDFSFPGQGVKGIESNFAVSVLNYKFVELFCIICLPDIEFETGGRDGRQTKVELVLNEAEQEQLHAWARWRKTAQALALRSRIALKRAGAVAGESGSRGPASTSLSSSGDPASIG